MAKTTWTRGLTMVSVNIVLAFDARFDNAAIDAVITRLEQSAERLEACRPGSADAVRKLDLNTPDESKGDDSDGRDP